MSSGWINNLLLSLNPCFRGSWFDGVYPKYNTYSKMSLNPCFRGSWFDGVLSLLGRIRNKVLILVFVEVGLMEFKIKSKVSRDES